MSEVSSTTSLESHILDILSLLGEKKQREVSVDHFGSLYFHVTGRVFKYEDYGYSDSMEMMQDLAERKVVQMHYKESKIFVSALKAQATDEDSSILNLSTLELPWELFGLPATAVDTERIDPLQLDQTAGVRLKDVTVTQVDSAVHFWFCLDRKSRDAMMKEMQRFYQKGEGREWSFSNPKYCRESTYMAATYTTHGFHRVFILKIFHDSDMVKVLYIDYGTKAKIPMTSIRPLAKKFLDLPCQAVEARLWGVQHSKDWPSKVTLLDVVKEDDCNDGDLIAIVMRKRPQRSRSGLELKGDRRLPVLLVDMLEEKCLNQSVVERNNSGWNTDDLLSLSLAESEVTELYDMEKMGDLEGGDVLEQLQMVNGELLSLFKCFGEKKRKN